MEEPRWSQELFYKAFIFAAGAHNGQKVPGTELPYITHIACVSAEIQAIITPEMNSKLLIQCAVLHDTIEDTDTTYDQLADLFGKDVADGVQALSKNYALQKPNQILDSIYRILKQPKEIWMIKMADRITNLNPPPDFWALEKKQSYLTQSLEILQAFSPANPLLAKRLQYKIETYKSYL